MRRQRVIVVGDVHGKWEKVNSLVKLNKPDLVFCTGDCIDGNDITYEGKVPFYFCDGDSDNHGILDKLLEKYGEKSPIEVNENMYFMPRGSVLTLDDGTNVGFAGGAATPINITEPRQMGGINLLTKERLIANKNFFPFSEELSDEGVLNMPFDGIIDIIISHTAPKSFNIFNAIKTISKTDKLMASLILSDKSREHLEEILKSYRPRLWVFGHLHEYVYGKRSYFKSDAACNWCGIGSVWSRGGNTWLP